MQADPTSVIPPSGRLITRFRDPVNGILHFAGLVIAAVATALLMARCHADSLHLIGAAVYGAGMCACFAGSALHHLVRGSHKLENQLLKLDHAGIYAFIAGGYTPMCLWLLPKPDGLILLAVVWSIALAGMIYKVGFAKDQADVNDPPSLADTLVYVLMGWLAVPELGNLVARAAPGTLTLLVIGGGSFSLGGLILTRRWLDFWPGRFGHHEIWHLFVLVGSAFTYAFIWGNV